jgi:hypothetical protein
MFVLAIILAGQRRAHTRAQTTVALLAEVTRRFDIIVARPDREAQDGYMLVEEETQQLRRRVAEVAPAQE